MTNREIRSGQWGKFFSPFVLAMYNEHHSEWPWFLQANVSEIVGRAFNSVRNNLKMRP